jgi:pimeloyl-ACP methyl ester carboxylesterase
MQWLNQMRAGPRPRSRYADADVLARKLLERNARLGAERAAFIARAWTRPAAGGGVETASDPWHRFTNPVLYRREEAEACWARISMPLLLVLAEESDYLTRIERDDDVQSMCRCVPQLEAVRLAALGHMMHHEDPAAVARPLVDFVHRSETRGA